MWCSYILRTFTLRWEAGGTVSGATHLGSQDIFSVIASLHRATVLTLKMSLVMQSLHTLVIIIHLINSVGVVNYMKPQVFRCVVVIYSALLLYNGRQDKLFHRSYSPWIKTFSPSWLQTTPSSSNSHITALQTITSHIYNGRRDELFQELYTHLGSPRHFLRHGYKPHLHRATVITVKCNHFTHL